ncbi:hypothetical protein ZIOFF_061076 [Zingiber officinale]|uniref:Uncharacterized protein n=1 Tax=Zingiber officinale TaxID=94328 RepID=A0A8J5FHL1_ZINOF|nr:hypothetical protein ZIOFF_061076 [Zingiber officinale]
MKETGIGFRKKRKPTNFLDISFKGGVLEIPQIEVDEDTNILLRNLIALEQCRINGSTAAGDDDPITAYALFMSCIIDTAADVEILQLKGIIVSRLGNNEQVAQFFNRLCKEVVVDYDRCDISRVFKEVNEHRNSAWNALRADLNRTYFGDPRSSLSFMTTIWSLYIAVMQLVLAFLNSRRRG